MAFFNYKRNIGVCLLNVFQIIKNPYKIGQYRGKAMKKRILCILLVLTACTTNNSEEVIVDPLYFVFATPLYSHPIWLQSKEGMADACDELGVQCDWQGPIRISTSDMNDVIHTALMKHADGIITQGVIESNTIEKGMQQNTPFVLVDSPVEGAMPLATISKDFDEQARILLTDIEKKLGKDAFLRIGMQVSDLNFDLAKQQVESVREIFNEHPGGYEIMAISESKSDQLHSRNEWMQVYLKEMDINVALNFAGENAIGCVDALDVLDIERDMLIYGVDDMEDTIKLIHDKRIEGSIVTSFYQYGYESVHLLYSYIKDGIPPKEVDIAANILLVNSENVDTYLEELKRMGL